MGGLPLATRVGLVLGTCAFVVGAVAVAALAARRAVLRITEAPVRLVAMLCGALLLAATEAAAIGSVPTDWQVLKGVGRELAGCRRGLLDAERTLAETELGRSGQSPGRTPSWFASRPCSARRTCAWSSTGASPAPRSRCAVPSCGCCTRPPCRPARRSRPRRPPVTGGLAVAFGEAGRPGKPHVFRNGVGLRVRPDEQIRSTAAGTVVFAGALAGAGEVVVISHGRRTFSVYGRVAEALVVRGMQVEAGEPVASAAEEGAVIYFSVRERGKPVDPVSWLRDDPEWGSGG